MVGGKTVSRCKGSPQVLHIRFNVFLILFAESTSFYVYQFKIFVSSGDVLAVQKACQSNHDVKHAVL